MWGFSDKKIHIVPAQRTLASPEDVASSVTENPELWTQMNSRMPSAEDRARLARLGRLHSLGLMGKPKAGNGELPCILENHCYMCM